MKSIKFNLILLLAAVFTFTSCDSDDDNGGDNNETGNFLRIDDDRFELSQGYIEEYGELQDGVYDWDVTLFSDDFDLTNEEEPTGTGEAIYLDLRTSNPNGLSIGTYTYSDEEEEDAGALTYVDAIAGIGISFESETGTTFIITSGTVTVSGTGSDQVIEFDLTASNGDAVTGRYKGALIEF